MENKEVQVIYHLPTGTPVYVGELCCPYTRKVTFPSAYFNQNGHKRPAVNLPKWQLTLEQMLDIMVPEFQKGKSPAGHCILFYLRQWMATIKNTWNGQDWTSYEVNIAKTGDVISPLDLLEVQDMHPNDAPQPALCPVLQSRPSVDAFAGLLLCAAQFNDSNNDGKSKNIQNKMKDMLSPMGLAPLDFFAVIGLVRDFCGKKEYQKLVAAFDMYFFQFSKTNLSKLRIGTSYTRFHGCGLQRDVEDFAAKLGLSLKQLEEWMCDERLNEQFQRLTTPIEESGLPTSYFPYMLPLELVQSSPYSMRTNLELYKCVHMTQAMMGVERSINANAARNIPNGFTMKIPMILFYVFTRDENAEDGLPKKKDVKPWIEYLKSERFTVPKVVHTATKQKLLSFKSPRKGSFGEYLLQQYF